MKFEKKVNNQKKISLSLIIVGFIVGLIGYIFSETNELGNINFQWYDVLITLSMFMIAVGYLIAFKILKFDNH